MREQDNRRHERDSLFLVADLRVERDGAPYSVKLRNVSDAGIMAEGPMRLTRGGTVWIDLPNIGEVAGTVAWTAGNRCGIAFDQEIDASEVRFPLADEDAPIEPRADLENHRRD
ncbi:hypothetical protein AB433_03815 [Croceicoccus naphthovorans]|uniref:PilZ domain-containing protein n=2 Tax=Croceicoccus naphthovorans TaxID=1348774 RepID=A0A0G3XM50_9SPHN|nr:hypothetical protein AB433_03815 [Croceicoccus naphthovorans]